MQKTSIILGVALIVSVLFSSLLVYSNFSLQGKNEELQGQNEKLEKENNRLLEVDSTRQVEIETINKTNQNLVDYINEHNIKYHQSINQAKIENVTIEGFSPYGGLAIQSTVTADIGNNGSNTLTDLVVTVQTMQYQLFSKGEKPKNLDPGESQRIKLPILWNLGTNPPVIIEVLLNGTLIATGTY